jgi:hypothetical protein
MLKSATIRPMSDVDTVDETDVRFNFAAGAAVAFIVGAILFWTARSGSTELLIAVAAVQALVGFALVIGLDLVGRRGALFIATLAAAGSDVVVSVWPHGRLGTQLVVFGLAVPAMFVHQLSRGAARHRVVESLGGVVLVVLAVVSLPALLQLRHEFALPSTGGHVVSGVVLVCSGGLVVGYLIDMIVTVPRFDADIPRGLLAVLGTASFGALAGHLSLRHSAEFAAGRGAFAGAAIGTITGLVAVAVAFLEAETPEAEDGLARQVRPLLGALVPLCLLAPVAFLLCLAIRS